eukprot:m51a1_g55 hypothetical protein (308) ;mRNA; f:176186-177315
MDPSSALEERLVRIHAAMAPVAWAREAWRASGDDRPWARAAFQSRLAQRIGAGEHRPARAYTRAFLRALMEDLEGAKCEIDDALLEMYLEFANAAPEDSALSHVTHSVSGVDLCFRLSKQLFPVGLATWPAGFFIAEWALGTDAGRAAVQGKRVLELGAGVGVAGIAIARLGSASSVAMSDFLPSVLDNLHVNAALNSCEQSTRVLCLDWDSAACCYPECDVALAADCVYDPDLAASLSKALAGVFAAGAKEAYVCNTVREPATLASFDSSLAKNGLKREDVMPSDPVPPLFLYDRPQLILWKITRS